MSPSFPGSLCSSQSGASYSVAAHDASMDGAVQRSLVPGAAARLTRRRSLCASHKFAAAVRFLIVTMQYCHN